MRVAMLLAAGALTGCAANTGVLVKGPGLFVVDTQASPMAGGAVLAKRDAFEIAHRHCNGAAVAVDETPEGYGFFKGMASFTLVFRCGAQ
jgi:hypothetical protein